MVHRTTEVHNTTAMGSLRKFAALNIKKIVGGKDPVRIVEEFILKIGSDPDKSLKDNTPQLIRWVIPLEDKKELEILLEGAKRPSEATIYLGMSALTVTLRGLQDLLVSAMEVADGLIGVKISLVGQHIVMSASLPAHGSSLEELEYFYELITTQRQWFVDAVKATLAGAPDVA